MKRTSLKVTFANGNSLVTTINEDEEGARRYYAKGRMFDAGTGENEDMQPVSNVEILAVNKTPKEMRALAKRLNDLPEGFYVEKSLIGLTKRPRFFHAEYSRKHNAITCEDTSIGLRVSIYDDYNFQMDVAFWTAEEGGEPIRTKEEWDRLAKIAKEVK